MLRIYEIKLDALEKTDALPAKVEKELHLPPGSVKFFTVSKESVDARKKPEICKVFNVDVEGDEKLIADACRKYGKRCERPDDYDFSEELAGLSYRGEKRPVIAGFGPCGIFAALTLAKAGARPIVLERGPAMDERIAAVERLWNEGILDPEANAQFGEGGAGTFSDGKLTTGTKSPYQSFVLKSFVKAGADPEILFKQRPHIGTDVLRRVVVNLRNEIEELGGEVLFGQRLERINIENNRLVSVTTQDRTVETDALILALGHSARDTVRALYSEGIRMSQKQFSMGIRIEHDQALIDRAQYGRSIPELGPADYKLNVRTREGRGVYTFCMCPGGEIVNASSSKDMVCCNGMSNFRRDSGRANSALLCDVRPDDFGSEHPLAGVDFQEKYERLAFAAGGSDYSLPRETLKAFKGEKSLIRGCLPGFVYNSLIEGIPELDKRLKGFDSPDALCYGIESRSSSPVRINRSENGLAFSGENEIEGLYPAGEGAGYAGGIMSAACDGIRAARRLL